MFVALKGFDLSKTKLEKVSIEQLKREIARRQRSLAKLVAKRDALNSRIAELESLGIGTAKPAESVEEAADHQRWLVASVASLETAYGESEPEYPASMIKERNPDYGK